MKHLLGKLDWKTFVLDLANACTDLPQVADVKLTRIDVTT